MNRTPGQFFGWKKMTIGIGNFAETDKHFLEGYRHVEGGWPTLRGLIEAGSDSIAAHLVMALGIADRETADLFGIGPDELAPGLAAVLV